MPNPCFWPAKKSPSYIQLFLYLMQPLEPVIQLFEKSPSYSHSSPHLYFPFPCFLPATNSPSYVAFFPALDQVSLPLPLGRSPSQAPSYRYPRDQKAKTPLPSACSLINSPSQYHPWELTNRPSPLGTPLTKQPEQRLPSGQMSLPLPWGRPSRHSLSLSQMSPMWLMAQQLASLVPSVAMKVGEDLKGCSFSSISMTLLWSRGGLSTGAKFLTFWRSSSQEGL